MQEKPYKAQVGTQHQQPPESPTHAPLQERESAVPAQPLAAKSQFWFVELWKENREVFKELIKHIFFFLLLIGSLIGFHELLSRSTLPPNQKEMLDKVHFYMSIIVSVIFSFSFIIKAIIYEFRGMRD